MTGGKKLVSLEKTGGKKLVSYCNFSISATCKRAANWTQNYKSPVSTLSEGFMGGAAESTKHTSIQNISMYGF